ncbi:uncharacterized protein LOC144661760 [Oculina patagonica]
MDSGEQDPELSRELVAKSYLDFETEPQLDFDTVYFESNYQQLVRDRDDLRLRYEREKRDRESLEVKFHQEYDQKIYFEEKLSELSRNLSTYEEELQALRLENSHLKAQFGQLRTAIQTRVGSSTAAMTQGALAETSLGTSGGVFISSSTSDGSVSVNTEMYKQEVALLAQENELFKQIIDVIDKQENNQVIMEDKGSVNTSERQRWLEEDVVRLEKEKAQLEDRVRELERCTREQERLLDEVNSKAEDNLRVYKRESKVLENELYSKSTVVEDYEVQMSQMKQSYEEEIHQVEIKLGMEISSNKQLQEQTRQLEENIRKLEEERKEILLKMEEAYKTENEIIGERTALEESYSRDVSELRRNVEEEIQNKAGLSMEIERLMGELIESDKQKKEMEARFFHEAQELKIQFEKEREEIVAYLNGSAVNQVMMQSNVAQQTHAGTQLVPNEPRMLTMDGEWKRKLNEEVRKKERLEEENKKLLYQINDLLEHNIGSGTSNTTNIKHNHERDVFEHTSSRQNVNDLVIEINELRENCRVLERDVKKKKELENKVIELSEEVEELTTKKDEMIRKQRELVKELDNSLSSVQQVEDKNRRLTEDVENLSKKIRQMEENFRNEKEDWVRNYSKDKTSQINDILSEKELIEKKYNEQVKINRSMEAEVNSFETRIYDLERANERLERKKSEITAQLTEEINFERSRAKTVKDELDKSVDVFKKQTEQLESTLYERKRKYDEEIRVLEEEKQRIRSEFENEKETYRRRFEDERKTMERRINEIEDRLRQQNAGSSELVANQTSLDYGEIPVCATGNQQTSSSASQQTISDLRSKIDTLRNENKELQETLRDIERNHSRKMDDLEYDNAQKIRKMKTEIEEEFRRKIDDYEKQIEQLKRTVPTDYKDSVERVSPCIRNPSGATNYQDGGGSMADLVRDQKEQMDELRRQIKLQMEAFENERQKLKRELQDERRNSAVGREGDSVCLHNTIRKLTEEVKKLKREKETILNKVKKERGSSNSRITVMTETVTKVKDECDRLRKEREDAQKSINDLRRKLTVTESKIRSMEEKHRREIHQLEIKFEYKKTEIEQDTTSIESQLRESLQMKYRAALDKEREKYEETLRVLRKEITSLQEQRKQIQLKLSSQGVQNTYSLLIDKSMSAQKESLFKSEMDVEWRVSRGVKQMEDRIYDLEREVELLKKEKYDIKASYKQEKVQMQEDFDRERDRLEEKYRRQIDDLKRRLHATAAQLQSSMATTKNLDRTSLSLRYSSDATELLHDKNFATKTNTLESQMNVLKDRMNDIEERQTRSLQSKTRKNTNVRFSSSLERGRDLNRQTNRIASSMVDLNLSSQQRSGMFDKSRIAHSPRGAARLSREARDTRSLLSQSLSDVRTQVQGTLARDDQYLSNRGYGIGGSSSVASARQSLFSSRSPSSFFHGRSLSGFDASRSSGFLQTGSSLRNDHLFLPSVGILGGISKSKAGGAFGGSMFGSYSGMSGSHSAIGFQRLMRGPAVFGQGVASGFDGRLYNSASLGNLQQQVQGCSLSSGAQGSVSGFDGRLYNSASLGNIQQQLSSEVQGCSLNSVSQQASVDVAGNSDRNDLSLTTSANGSQKATASQQAEGCEYGDASDAAGISEVSHPQSAMNSEPDLNDSVNDQSHVTAIPQQVEDQAVVDLEVEPTSLQATDLGSQGNYEDTTTS